MSAPRPNGPAGAHEEPTASGGAWGPLDNYTKSTSGPSQTESGDRFGLQRLQTAAATLTPDHRVATCGRYVVPTKDLQVVCHEGRHYFRNLQRCGSVWLCPVCQAKISLHRAPEVSCGVEAGHAQGFAVAIVTVTARHTADDTLADQERAMRKARSGLLSGRRANDRRKAFGIVGTIANVEVTYGFDTGWHPHSHILVFYDPSCSLDELADDLWRGWEHAATRQGLEVSRDAFSCKPVRLKDAECVGAYLAKPDASAKHAWNVGEELTATGAKDAEHNRMTPFQLAEAWMHTRHQVYADRWREYAEVFGGVGQGRGRRHLFWSRGLRDRLFGKSDDEASDEELANADGQGEAVGALRRDEAAFLFAHDLRTDFLAACDAHGFRGALHQLRRWREELPFALPRGPSPGAVDKPQV